MNNSYFQKLRFALVNLKFLKLAFTLFFLLAVISLTFLGKLSFATAKTQTSAPDGAFYYYYFNDRVPLTVSLKWVAVKFASDKAEEQTAALQNFDNLVEANDKAREIPHPKLILLPLKAGLTIQSLKDGIDSLRKDHSHFLWANPVFQSGNSEELVITDEFIASFPPEKTRVEIDSINSSHKVELVEPISGQVNTFVLRVSPAVETDSLSMANLFQESGAAKYAAPNFLHIIKPDPANTQTNQSQTSQETTTLAATNDPNYNLQWYLNNTKQFGTFMKADADIDAPEAWSLPGGSGNSSIYIAVIDYGVDLFHEDIVLAEKIINPFDATGQGSGGAPSGANPGNGHGTNVAGIAAASTNNSIGIAGVCPNCRIMPVRIMYVTDDGSTIFDEQWAASGIDWAVMNQASVINLSWRSTNWTTVITTAINKAMTNGRNGKGIAVVAASGNDNTNQINYPAILNGVISVGALNMCDQRKRPLDDDCNAHQVDWGSTYGLTLDISAPGIQLFSTDTMGSLGYSVDNYFDFWGTSGATPIVSGVAGLILSVNPNLTQSEVKTMLKKTADDIRDETNLTEFYSAGWDKYTGSGRVNAYKAVRCALNDCWGDANQDSKVDGLDYLIWLKHYNQTVTGGRTVGDFDNNGIVDGRDYVIWRDNYDS